MFAVSELKVTKRNVHYSPNKIRRLASEVKLNPSVALEQEIDLTIKAVLKPIKVVYRPVQIQKVIDLFTIENVNAELK